MIYCDSLIFSRYGLFALKYKCWFFTFIIRYCCHHLVGLKFFVMLNFWVKLRSCMFLIIYRICENLSRTDIDTFQKKLFIFFFMKIVKSTLSCDIKFLLQKKRILKILRFVQFFFTKLNFLIYIIFDILNNL